METLASLSLFIIKSGKSILRDGRVSEKSFAGYSCGVFLTMGERGKEI